MRELIDVNLPRRLVGKLTGLVPRKSRPIRRDVLLGNFRHNESIQFVFGLILKQFRVEDNRQALIAGVFFHCFPFHQPAALGVQFLLLDAVISKIVEIVRQ